MAGPSLPETSPSSGRLLAAIVPGFLLLAIAATWPVIGNLGSALPSDLGDPLLNAWILGWDADRLQHGLRGLWDAPILYPNTLTLAFSEHLLGIAVPLAPLVWLTHNPIAAYNVAFILSYALAATGMFLLAQFLTGSVEAAVIAAVAFAFGPNRADQISHLQVLSAGWMPICLWALHRYWATWSRRALALFAVAFVWQALSNMYFLYFLALPVAVVMLFEIWARRDLFIERRPALTRTGTDLVCAALAILLLLAPVLKIYEDVRQMYGLHRSYGDLVNFSAHVESYLHVAEPVRIWKQWLATSLSPERQLFPGLTVLILSALALFRLPISQSPIPNPQSPTRRYVLCYLTITLLAFLLSLGAEPSAWGHRVLPFSPYLLLARIVPGLDGLRAPARFAVVVQLGLSVLAAIGFANSGKAKRWALTFFVVGAIVVEGWAAPIRLAAFDAQGRVEEHPLYAWLAARPPGGVLELPIKSWDVAPTLTYQYATLFHHHPIVNGYSGYGSALQEWLGGSTSPLPEIERMDATIEALRSVGIRFVVVHRNDFDDTALADGMLSRLRALGPQLADSINLGGTAAFELAGNAAVPAPLDLSHLHALPAAQLHVTTSDGPDRLPAAFDGNLDTRWFTGRVQAGDEWIRIDFDQPTRVAGVRLQMSARSLADYPRGLAVEGIDQNGGATTTLRDGPVLAELAQAVLAGSDYPSIDIALPPTAAPVRAIVLKQTGSTRSWYWSIYEMQVLSR